MLQSAATVAQKSAVIFDLGNTLVSQLVDSECTLDRLPLQLVPGAAETVRGLYAQRRFALAVLSNTEQSRSSHVTAALLRLGIHHYFDVILTSVDLGVRKPAAGAFLSTLEALRVDPGAAVMVGNDTDADIAGAHHLGITTAFFSSDSRDWHSLANCRVRPDYILRTLLDLLPVMRQLSPR